MHHDRAAIRDALAHQDAVLTLERIERVTVHRVGTTPAAAAPGPIAFEAMHHAIPASTSSSSSLLATGFRWLVVSLFVLGALGFFVMTSGASTNDRRTGLAPGRTRTDPAVAGDRPAAPTVLKRARRPPHNVAAPRSASNAHAASEPVETTSPSASPASYVTSSGREIIRAPAGALNATDSPLLR